MAVRIISDPDADMSVIVDDEIGRPYGYIVSGGDHRQLLELFIDSLAGQHPGLFAPHEFDRIWDAFSEGLQSAVAERDSEADAEPGPDGSEAASEPTAAAAPAPDDAQDPTMPSAEPSPASTPSHGTSRTPTTMQCFNCNGTGVQPHDGATCAVCGGSGEITVSPMPAPK